MFCHGDERENQRLWLHRSGECIVRLSFLLGPRWFLGRDRSEPLWRTEEMRRDCGELIDLVLVFDETKVESLQLIVVELIVRPAFWFSKRLI